MFLWAAAVGAAMYAIPLLLHFAGLLTSSTLVGSLLASWAVSAIVPAVYRWVDSIHPTQVHYAGMDDLKLESSHSFLSLTATSYLLVAF